MGFHSDFISPGLSQDKMSSQHAQLLGYYFAGIGRGVHRGSASLCSFWKLCMDVVWCSETPSQKLDEENPWGSLYVFGGPDPVLAMVFSIRLVDLLPAWLPDQSLGCAFVLLQLDVPYFQLRRTRCSTPLGSSKWSTSVAARRLGAQPR